MIALDDADFFELAQTLREQRRRHARYAASNVIEACTAAQQFANDPHRDHPPSREAPAATTGQPGLFSLGGDGILAAAYSAAGFSDITVRRVDSPVRLQSAAECVRFERESFSALHQMMSGLGDTERAETWQEIEHELQQFEEDEGFVGPCEMLVGAGAA